MTIARTLFAGLVVAQLTTVSARAEEWGTLTGRFVYGGALPAPKEIDTSVSNDAFCRQIKVPLEDLVVDKDGGLANVVIYLRPAPNQKVAVHPDYAATAEATVTVDNKDCRFQPRVVVLRTSQTLLIRNPDNTSHNSKLTALNPRNPSINPIIPAGSEIPYKFNVEEPLPAILGCNIHTWMSASVVVRDLPYAAASGADGRFKIENIPVGSFEFQLHHSKSGYVSEAELGGKKQTWSRGRAKFTIKPGENDLGDIKLPESLFTKG
jgi:hypothetical protein